MTPLDVDPVIDPEPIPGPEPIPIPFPPPIPADSVVIPRRLVVAMLDRGNITYDAFADIITEIASYMNA